MSLFPSLGVAVGYLYGNLATIINWRICFYIEAAVALPVVLFCLFATPVRLRGKEEQTSTSSGDILRIIWLCAEPLDSLKPLSYLAREGKLVISASK